MKRILLFISLFFCSIAYSQLNDLTVHYTGTDYKKATGKKVASQTNYTISNYISKGKRLTISTYPNFELKRLIENNHLLILTETRNQKYFKDTIISDSTKVKHQSKKYGPLIYTNEKKTILGYSCTKVTLTKQELNGDSTLLTGWITDNLSTQFGFLPAFSDFEIPNKRIMVELEWEDARGANKIIATEISTKPIPASIFILSTKGYKEIQQKDLQNKKS